MGVSRVVLWHVAVHPRLPEALRWVSRRGLVWGADWRFTERLSSGKVALNVTGDEANCSGSCGVEILQRH